MVNKLKKIDPELKLAAAEALFDIGIDPVVIVDQKGRILDINKAVTDVSGWKRQELVGKNFAFIGIIEKSYLKEVLTKFRYVLKGRKVPTFEMQINKKPKGLAIVSLTATPIKKDKKIIGSIVHFRDITQRRALMEELAHREENYRTVFENTGAATCIIEADKTLSLVNREFEKLSGYSKKEIEGKIKWTRFVTREERKQMEDYHRLRRSAKGKAPKTYKFDFVDREKKIHRVKLFIDVIPGTEKSVGSLIDVTKEQQALTQLARSETKYRSIFESSPELVMMLDKKGTCVDVNNRILEWSGYSREEVIGKSLLRFSFLPHESKTVIARNFAKRMMGKKIPPYDIKVITKKGVPLWGRVVGSAMKDEEGKRFADLVMISNVTEEKESAKQMIMLSRALEQEQDGVVVTDLEKRVLYVNNSWQKIYCTSIKKGSLMDDYFSKKSKPAYLKIIKMLSKQSSMICGFRCSTVKNRKIPCLLAVTKLKDDRGKPFGFLHTFQDITEQKEYEHNLKRARARAEQEKKKLGIILEELTEAVVVTDRQNRVILFNQVAGNLTNVSAEAIIGKKPYDFFQFIDEKGEKNKLPRFGEKQSAGRVKKMPGKLSLVRPGRENLPIAASIRKVKGPFDIGEILVFRDVSIEREIDRQKTEFISVASHQLRTPLSAIKWFLEILISGDAGSMSDEQMDYMDQVYKSNERMINLVNDLLKLKKMNLDPKLIRQAVMNILDNAIKYSPEKTTVTIDMKVKKPNLILSIADRGHGIPEKEQSRVFTKFYRGSNIVKKVTQGTGLGLYVVKTVIEAMGGSIRFESTENKGTTFYLSIPLAGSKRKKGEVSLL